MTVLAYRSPPRLCRRQGDAVFCRFCDGAGVRVQRLDGTDQPVKCERCGGEGLEPKPQGEILKLLEEKSVPLLGMADLSAVQRREIVELTLRRHKGREEVARRYNVSREVVSQIMHQYRSGQAMPEDSAAMRSVLAPRTFSWEAEA